MKALVLKASVFMLLIPLIGIRAEEIKKTNQDYLLSPPRNASETMPVLIALPGLNVLAKDDQNNWKFIASKNGFLLINMEIDYNAIKAPHDVGRLHDRIFEIIQEAHSKYPNLDKKRVYLAGTSMGGMMAISMALRYPKDFLATTIVCGGRFRFGADQFLGNAKGLRFYFAHGAKDDVVPIEDFYQVKEALRSHGAIINFDVYPESGHILSGAYRKAFESLISN